MSFFCYNGYITTMERIRHIRETQRKDLLSAQTELGEVGPVRDVLMQHDMYDPKTETHEKQIRVREDLNSFDESALKEIIFEYFRKSGSDETTMNWIPFEKVRIIYKSPEEEEGSRSPHGDYSISKGIRLYCHKLDQGRNQVLWTLIHEECHAISQDEVRTHILSNESDGRTGVKKLLQSGVSLSVSTYDDNESKNAKRDVYNNGINEGITELLTERIFREYIKRTGSEHYEQNSTKAESITDTEKIIAETKFDAYERNWQNAKLYIGIISAITDVPEDIVENAVIRTYIRNGDIILNHDSEIEQMLHEIYPNLSTILYNMLNSRKGDGIPLESYVNVLSQKDIPNDVKQKIITALQKIKEEWGDAYKLAPGTV